MSYHTGINHVIPKSGNGEVRLGIFLLVVFSLLFSVFLFIACDCEEEQDDQEPDSMSPADQDDDDNNNNDSDNDDDDDDDNDDDTPDRIYRVLPTDINGLEGDEVLLWDLYEESGENHAKFTLFDLTGQKVYEHPAVSLGTQGAVTYSVRDFDGQPPAEIVVNYFHIDLTKAKETFSSWAQVLRGTDFLPVYETPELSDMQVLTKASFDLNMDGHPEWVIEKRPMEPAGTGECEIYDITNGLSLLNITAGTGKSLELAGLRGEKLYMSPAPVTGMSGDRFLVSIHTVSGDGSVEIYLRDASEPNETGVLVDQADLIRNAAYTQALVDHDQDGTSDIFLLIQEESQTRYYYGDHFFGTLSGCVSYSADFAPDLDGDQVQDLVISGHRCESPSGDAGKLFYRLSTLPDLVKEQSTVGAGDIFSFWRPDSGLSDIYQAHSGDEFAQVLADNGASAFLKLALFAPDSFVNPIWESAELSPMGEHLNANAWIDDYTGDKRLDIAMFAAGVDIQIKSTIYYTNFYLFEGPALNQISPFEYADEYWVLGTPWDFNKDQNADMFMQRYVHGTEHVPKIIIMSPSNEFEILYEVAHPTSSSMGLVGLYQ